MPHARSLTGRTPAVAGVLTEAEIRATGETIAAAQEESGAIGWPDGQVDAWNHVECAMALSVCGPTNGCGRPSGPTAPGHGVPRPAAR